MSTRPPTEAVAEGNSWAVRVLTAGLGLALLTLGIGSWRTLSEMRMAAAKIQAQETKTIALLQAENQRLAPETTPAIPPTPIPKTLESKPTLEVQRVEALDFLMDLARRGYFATPSPLSLLRELSISLAPNIKKVPQPPYMIDANGNFGPGFADFFGLTGSEAASLQSGLSAWRDEMARAIQAKTTVRRQDDGSVVLDVSPIEASSALSGRFVTLLQEGLGPERYRLFDDLNSGSRPGERGLIRESGLTFTGNLNFFGEATATYTVKRRPTGISVDYKIKTQNGNSSGSGGGGNAVSPEEMREQLIKAHGPVMKLLPADF